jgi:hypothetical protein
MTFFRGRRDDGGFAVHYEHATQPLAASFLKAAVEGDVVRLWEALSRESRGLLEGRYASRTGLRLARAAHVGEEPDDARVPEIAGPLGSSILRALGGAEKVNAFAVSAARVISRGEAFVLLLPEFQGGTFVREEEWRPAHVLGFVYENREWKVDLGLTASLSEEAALPDPLGELR